MYMMMMTCEPLYFIIEPCMLLGLVGYSQI